MKFEPMTCPECQEPAIGTLEEVSGCAHFTEPDEHGHVEYDGDTEIFWEGQMTVERELDPPIDGNGPVLMCNNGHDWVAREIEEEEAVSTAP